MLFLKQKGNMERTYSDSLYYHLRLTARYMKTFGKQLFNSLNIDIDFDELIILDLLFHREGLIQRDLAKLLLTDRANAGRLASSLEKKDLVEIKIQKKANRLVKMILLTEFGKKTFEECVKKIAPKIEEISKMFNGDEEATLNRLLIDFRNKLSSAMEIHI